MDWSVLKVSLQKTEHQHIDDLMSIHSTVEHAFNRLLRESPQRYRDGRMDGHAIGRSGHRELEEVRLELTTRRIKKGVYCHL